MQNLQSGCKDAEQLLARYSPALHTHCVEPRAELEEETEICLVISNCKWLDVRFSR